MFVERTTLAEEILPIAKIPSAIDASTSSVRDRLSHRSAITLRQRGRPAADFQFGIALRIALRILKRIPEGITDRPPARGGSRSGARRRPGPAPGGRGSTHRSAGRTQPAAAAPLRPGPPGGPA